MGASASQQTNQLTAAWQAGLAHAQWLIWNEEYGSVLIPVGGIRNHWAASASEWEKSKSTDRTQKSVGGRGTAKNYTP